MVMVVMAASRWCARARPQARVARQPRRGRAQHRPARQGLPGGAGGARGRRPRSCPPALGEGNRRGGARRRAVRPGGGRRRRAREALGRRRTAPCLARGLGRPTEVLRDVPREVQGGFVVGVRVVLPQGQPREGDAGRGEHELVGRDLLGLVVRPHQVFHRVAVAVRRRHVRRRGRVWAIHRASRGRGGPARRGGAELVGGCEARLRAAAAAGSGACSPAAVGRPGRFACAAVCGREGPGGTRPSPLSVRRGTQRTRRARPPPGSGRARGRA